MNTGPSRLRDAALALVVLVPTVALRLTGGEPVSLAALAAGAAITLAVEWALGRRAETVRRCWADGRLRVATVVVGLLAVAVAIELGAWALTTLAGGLGAYLLALAATSLRERLAR